MAASTISTRFLILSDTYNYSFPTKSSKFGPKFLLPTPHADVLPHCGDLTNKGGLRSYEQFLAILGAMNADLKLVIAGNHDLSLDGEYWASNHSEWNEQEHEQAINIMTGEMAKEAGVLYLEEGKHEFTLKNGARLKVYASPYQPESSSGRGGWQHQRETWAFQYPPKQDRFNSPYQVAPGIKSKAKHPMPGFDFGEVDVVMTHGPPKGVLDKVEGRHEGCGMLLLVVGRAKPQIRCFGHIHAGYGAKVVSWGKEGDMLGTGNGLVNMYPGAMEEEMKAGEETLMLNAALRDAKGIAKNVPWLVDLKLPIAD